MMKFAMRLLLFLIVPLPLLYGLNYIVDKGLQRSHHFYYAEWNDLLKGKINADVLICGSSRAWVHISPRILDSALHVNSYNIGMDGSLITMQYDRVKIYLQHNKPPRYIVHALDLGTLSDKRVLYASQQLLPYLDDTAIRAIAAHYNDAFSWADYYVPMYKYNNELMLVKEGVFSYLGRGVRPVKYKGYKGQKARDTTFNKMVKNIGAAKERIQKSAFVDSAALHTFYDYLDLCRKNNIQVILVYTPFYHGFLQYFDNRDSIFQIYRDCVKTHGAVYLDYSEDELSKNIANFYNAQHLNRKGAEAFSQKLANDLKPIMDVSGKMKSE